MRLLFLFSTLVLGGCDDHIFPAVGGSSGDDVDPDWDGMQSVMAEHCSECHPSLSIPSVPDEIERDVVDGTGTWVVPGDPDASEFYLVMTGESQVTSLMPLGASEPLDETITDAVRQWILDGAEID